MERREFTFFILMNSILSPVVNWGVEADERFSKLLYDNNKYQTACIWIEWLVHGFPWFAFSTLSIILAYGKDFSFMTQYGFVVLNIGLYFDVILIAIIKFYVHRQRPEKTYSRYFENTVDIYSFPSGHSSRAAMLVVMLYNFTPTYAIPFIPIPVVVGLSRVASGRHYITDAIAGLFIGYVEGRLMLTIPYGLNTLLRDLIR